MIGCDCAVCRSSDPRDQRLRSSIYVRTPEACWVVDTGTDFRTQALRENIRRVDAVVFTHSHTDHIMGFDDLRRFSYERGSMPVYASAETMRALERVFEFAFKTANPFPGYLKPEPHIISGPFQLGSTTITPLPVPHGEFLVNGYLFSRRSRNIDFQSVPPAEIDSVELKTADKMSPVHTGTEAYVPPRNEEKLVAYLSDCSGVPNVIVDLIAGVNVLIIDALREKPHPTHLSVEQAIEVAERVRPGETYFTHIAHELPQAAESRLPAHTHIAYDGLKLDL
ncbi:MAG: phosphoribosyl 1,2-cyclic phosphate phosphodiesterase [Verrucomicrobiota bacterium]